MEIQIDDSLPFRNLASRIIVENLKEWKQLEDRLNLWTLT